METKFNLSEKIREAYPDYYPDNIPVEDVKEFIKRLKEETTKFDLRDLYQDRFIEVIDKLAGDKLK